MPILYGQRIGNAFVPYLKYGQIMDEIPEGYRLKLTVDRERNGKYNSLLHVLLDKVARAANRGPAKTDVETLKQWVKLKNGWFDVVPLPMPVAGQTHAVAYRSTSFAKMGEAEFHTFAERTCDMIRDELAAYIVDAPEWPEIQGIIASIAPHDEVPE